MTFYSEVVAPDLQDILGFGDQSFFQTICACLQQTKTFFSRKAGREVFILNVAVP
jgi:hypothetical protein